MSEAWDDMRKAKEEQYFNKLNSEALEALKKRKAEREARKSPITGKPMEQVELHGVIVDRCVDSGGLWLDAGELEQLMGHAQNQGDNHDSLLASFFKVLSGDK